MKRIATVIDLILMIKGKEDAEEFAFMLCKVSIESSASRSTMRQMER